VNKVNDLHFVEPSKLQQHIGSYIVLTSDSDNDAIRVITEINTTEPVQTIHLKRSIMGQPLFGGSELANTLITQASATQDTINKSVKFHGRNVASKVLYAGPFKENTQYTFIIYGRNADVLGTALNMRFRYTDGTTSAIFHTKETGHASYNVFVSSADKTL